MKAHRMLKRVVLGIAGGLSLTLLAAPALAQVFTRTWTPLPQRTQVLRPAAWPSQPIYHSQPGYHTYPGRRVIHPHPGYGYSPGYPGYPGYKGHPNWPPGVKSYPSAGYYRPPVYYYRPGIQVVIPLGNRVPYFPQYPCFTSYPVQDGWWGQVGFRSTSVEVRPADGADVQVSPDWRPYPLEEGEVYLPQ